VDDKEMDRVVKELLRLPDETARHREAISRIAARRRELAGRLGEALGPTQAAKRLGISRQTFWQILNPDQAKEIKKRSKAVRRPTPDPRRLGGADKPGAS
jgi:predicted DNA-binding transcriptional regulator AlpA